MEFLFSLWLPILLSSAAVWIASIILGLPYFHHKNDWVGLPAGQEGALMEFLRRSGVAPGNYLFPDFRTPEAMESEKVKRALETGPVGHLSVWGTPLSMGGKMAGTFVVYLAASVLIGYLAWVALPKGAGFAKVFQVVGTAGVLTYCFSFVPSAVWFGAYRRAIVAGVVDGVVFGVVTGLVFAGGWAR